MHNGTEDRQTEETLQHKLDR